MIGHLTGHVDHPRTADANGGDSALGNLIADAQKADPTIVRNGVKPVVALMNPGGIRADLVENADGDVTYGAAFAVQPFNNMVVSMDLTGAQIKTILNQQWNGNNEPATAPQDPAGLRPELHLGRLGRGACPAPNAIVGDVMIDADGDSGTPMVPLVRRRRPTGSWPTASCPTVATTSPASSAGTNKLVGGLDIDSLRLFLRRQRPDGADADRPDQPAAVAWGP